MISHQVRPGRLTTWCRLLRLPNLFTVPGDSLAGFMLATSGVLDWRVAGAMATSLLLYAAGLLLNDYFDREIDARERPDRPIPSGAVPAGSVLGVGLVLLVAGGAAGWLCGLHAGAVTTTLALVVLCYDSVIKRVKIAGPVVMGACRGFSVLVGASFALGLRGSLGDPMAAFAAAAVTWAYTTAVSFLAAGETGGAPVCKKAFVPGVVLAAGGAAMMPFFSSTGGARFFGIAFVAIAVVEAAQAATSAYRGRIPVPAFIGRLIRTMIVAQAAWCLWPVTPESGAAGVLALGGLVAMRTGAEWASRRFYGS